MIKARGEDRWSRGEEAALGYRKPLLSSQLYSLAATTIAAVLSLPPDLNAFVLPFEALR